jgi:hypothetical protein
MPGIARGIAYQVAPSQIVHLGRHCCPSKNRIKNRVRLGNEKERGGSRPIAAEYIFLSRGLSVSEQSIRGSRHRSSQEGHESRNRSPIVLELVLVLGSVFDFS